MGKSKDLSTDTKYFLNKWRKSLGAFSKELRVPIIVITLYECMSQLGLCLIQEENKLSAVAERKLVGIQAENHRKPNLH